MFCITGIFKCFTPHEDARRATPRHATPRRAAQLYTLLYPTILFSSLSVSLTSLPPTFSPLSLLFFLSSPFIPFFSFLFSRPTNNTPKVRAPIGPPFPPSPRESETIIPARGGKRKKEISIFFLRVSSTRFGDKVLFFFFFFFLLFRPVYYYSILVCNLSLHGFHATCRCLPHYESARRLLNISRPTIGHRSVARYRRYYSANL